MMDTKLGNAYIACSVCECAHHSQDKDVCALNSIRVSCCGPTGTDCDCTECASYELSQKPGKR